MKICENPITEIAIDINEIKDTNKKNYKEKICTFLVAGRMIYRKGHEFLLDALKRIPKEVQYECRIIGDGPEMKNMQLICNADENLSEHVIFVGSVPYDYMENEYKKADVFIMPSIRETTGTVLLEAMSKGLPVITINKFGGTILLDDNTGWLYNGNDKESYIENLKNAILECIKNPIEVQRRGKNALKSAEKYTWENKNKHYQKIYSELI